MNFFQCHILRNIYIFTDKIKQPAIISGSILRIILQNSIIMSSSELTINNEFTEFSIPRNFNKQ